jgi:hypothetical protein
MALGQARRVVVIVLEEGKGGQKVQMKDSDGSPENQSGSGRYMEIQSSMAQSLAKCSKMAAICLHWRPVEYRA